MVSVGPKTIYPGKLHLVLKTAVQSTINYIMPIQKLMSSTKLQIIEITWQLFT